MMDESELRRRFAELREADRERAPSFAQTYGRARASELACDAARAAARDRRGGGRRDRRGLARACAIVLAVRGHTNDRDLARADGRPSPDSRQRAARCDARPWRVRSRHDDSYTFQERNLT